MLHILGIAGYLEILTDNKYFLLINFGEKSYILN